MPEELKDLIAKIQEEGVRRAEDKAKAIEEEASLRAKSIVEKAEAKAENIIGQAKDRAVKAEENTKEALRQAGRDLMLTLRKEIDAMLDKLIISSVHKALGAEEIAKIITALVKSAKTEEKKDIQITLKKEDLERLQKGLFGELKEEIKKGITLRSSEDMRGGFTISYDKGRSMYDFTDKALAEYMGSHLKPKLAELLNSGKAPGKK